MYKYYEIVKTIFLDPIYYGPDDNPNEDTYKIEIYKNQDNLYFSRFFRLERFDLNVTIGNRITPDDLISSEEVYVKDDFLYITEEKSFDNMNDCLTFALQKLEEFYSGKKTMKEINIID